MYPIFGMYSVHKLHVHTFVLFLDKSILNVSMSLTDFIPFHLLLNSIFGLLCIQTFPDHMTLSSDSEDKDCAFLL